MNSSIRRGLSLVAILSLGLIPLNVANATEIEQNENNEEVSIAIQTYSELIRTVLVDNETVNDDLDAVEAAQIVNETYEHNGSPIKSAIVEIQPQSFHSEGDMIVVNADISNEIHIVENPQIKQYVSETLSDEIGWSDNHQIVLMKVPAEDNYEIIEDTLIKPEPLVFPDGQEGTQLRALQTVQKPTSSNRIFDPSGTEVFLNKMNNAQAENKEPVKLRRSASAAPSPLINIPNFMTYVDTYTSGSYMGDGKLNFNPDYPYFDNNCANFVSQAVNVAGLNMRPGVLLDKWSHGVWTTNVPGLGTPSHTWGGASNNYDFMLTHSGVYLPMNNIWEAKPGDLLYVDWDYTKGATQDDINHVMAVSGIEWNASNGTVTPLISQKTPNRHNLLLSASIALAEAQGNTNLRWYGLTVKWA